MRERPTLGTLLIVSAVTAVLSLGGGWLLHDVTTNEHYIDRITYDKDMAAIRLVIHENAMAIKENAEANEQLRLIVARDIATWDERWRTNLK